MAAAEDEGEAAAAGARAKRGKTAAAAAVAAGSDAPRIFEGVRARFVGLENQQLKVLRERFVEFGGEIVAADDADAADALLVARPGLSRRAVCEALGVAELPAGAKLVDGAWVSESLRAKAALPVGGFAVAAAAAPAAKAQATMDAFLGRDDKASFTVVHHGGDACVEMRPTALPAGAKVAAFDLDGTLVHPKSGRKFATGRGDWTWLYPQVPTRLQQLAREGFHLVVFSNQQGVSRGHTQLDEVTGRVADIAAKAGVALHAFLALDEGEFRKPATGMLALLEKEMGAPADRSVSFFVGDAAGRPAGHSKDKKKDFSATDRMFALNARLAFHTPEEFFLGAPQQPHEPLLDLQALAAAGERDLARLPQPLASPARELVLFVGPPAAGKTTFFERHFAPHGYTHVNRDTLKSVPKCLDAARKALAAGKSVVIDNTSPDRESRAEYLAIAKAAGVPARCLFFQTRREVAEHLNRVRERLGGKEHVPAVGFHSFYKRLQEPTAAEGFAAVLQVPFAAHFASERERAAFLQFSG